MTPMKFANSAIRMLAAVVLATISMSSQLHAQNFTVLHSFGAPYDGQHPDAPVTLDSYGNLYGTTYDGGAHGGGIVFKLTPRGSSWVYSSLYNFQGNPQGQHDGANPIAAVTIGPDGAVYGATAAGGSGPCDHNYGFFGCGTVFELQPPATFCNSVQCPWRETVLYRFTGGNDGDSPSLGGLVFDPEGNLYGTTVWGGYGNYGVVYKMSRSGGNWTESVIQNLDWQTGVTPVAGVVFDSAGNLYGAGEEGGGDYGCGTDFQLTPGQSGWSETVIHSFTCTPHQLPEGGISIGPDGNLYGKFSGTPTEHGGVYQLVYNDYGWTMNILYRFDVSSGDGGWWQGGGPVFDQAGNLYSTTYSDGAYGMGTVFRLTPGAGGWTYTSLHDFTGGSDGANPHAGLAIDAQGHLYGTTKNGGDNNRGVVYEVVP